MPEKCSFVTSFTIDQCIHLIFQKMMDLALYNDQKANVCNKKQLLIIIFLPKKW